MPSFPERLRSVWNELRRRHFFRTTGLYVAASYAVLQVAQLLADALALPNWTTALLFTIAVVGYPIAIVVSWSHHSYRVICSDEELRALCKSIAEEAEEILYATGSRSRDLSYMLATELRLKELPRLCYYRVLFGPPHKEELYSHLLNVLQVRNPADRSLGRQLTHIGVYRNFYKQFEANIVGNERRAVIVLPSLVAFGSYNSALVVTDAKHLEGLSHFVRELYLASEPIEEPSAIASLGVYKPLLPAGPDSQ